MPVERLVGSANEDRGVNTGEWFRELAAIRGLASPRKAQLFAVACCRRVWDLMTGPRHRAAVEAADRLADGAITPAEFEAAARPVADLYVELPDDPRVERNPWQYLTAAARHLGSPGAVLSAASHAARAAARTRGISDSPAWDAGLDAEGAAQRELLRDVVGPADRPGTLDPAWLTTPVRALAGRMYESGDFSLMPILADALEDAGCDDPEVLDHCRGEGPHVRGCWVVDLVLGKA